MQLIENTKVLILHPSDMIERFQSEFDVINLQEFMKYFDFDVRVSILTSSLVLFIDTNGTTIILKNRYGKPQI